MSLDVDAVNRIAFLARLQITEEQVSGFASNLSNILEFVEQMDAVDTTGVEPMAHPQDMTQPLRVDQVTEADQREMFQQQSPAVENGLFLVPKVIE
ncbi:unnamed protein product [Cyprideis torosa]|uniref:Glutamyl-tRNA(Gln) amidotransferase subunit C, mitochondrial n=1 Tax=Cyprideis torosa TaxID=163714 RepID=A0A7R8WX54_9CRUS|nr:unnamed protein product [Cyprideis torosa]CAG0911791.1 unnamed protein product [Cyprideis torosa]